MQEADKLTVVMYHYVRDLKNSRYPEIKGLDLDDFKGQIDHLKKNYNFVTIEDVISAYNAKAALPPKSVLLTFDDAYVDHFTNVFPILHNEGIQGAFYPPVKAITENIVLDVNKIHFTLASVKNINLLVEDIKILLNEYREEYKLESFDYYFAKLGIANRFDPKEVIFVKRLLQVELEESLRQKISNILFAKYVSADERAFSRELYMNDDQIKCMATSGMHIGSHGYDHYWLGSLSPEKQRFEIEESIKFIQRIGGNIDTWTISYPYGNYNMDTIRLLQEYKCQLGFTTIVDRATIDIEKNSTKRFEIPRLDTNDLPKR